MNDEGKVFNEKSGYIFLKDAVNRFGYHSEELQKANVILLSRIRSDNAAIVVNDLNEKIKQEMGIK